MQSLEIVQDMIDYHYKLYDRVWESVRTLTDEQFVADAPYSHGSIRNHLVHVADVDMSWVQGLKGMTRAERPPRLEPQEYPTRASVQTLFKEAEKYVRDYVASLSDDDLAHRPEHMPMAIWKTILHLVNHGTDHRGQVLRILHDAGAATFDQDLAFYYMSQK